MKTAVEMTVWDLGRADPSLEETWDCVAVAVVLHFPDGISSGWLLSILLYMLNVLHFVLFLVLSFGFTSMRLSDFSFLISASTLSCAFSALCTSKLCDRGFAGKKY